MQRYFMAQTLQVSDELFLDKTDNHHLVNVMRAKPEAEVQIVDSTNQLYIAVVSDIIEGKARLKISEKFNSRLVELPIAVTIATGLSKNDKLDYIVQKSTECGMREFIPLALKRDVVKWPSNKVATRIERMRKIAKEAAEQSQRLHIPDISALMSIEQLLERANLYDYCLVAYEETAKKAETGVLKRILTEIKAGESILMVFGSEGGFAPEEVEQLQRHGFELCSLGPRILRAETAPVYALSAMSYQLEI